MHQPNLLSLLITIAVVAGPSFQQQKDPLKDFCRRFGHQTAVIDNRLFIDGGLLNWNPLDLNPLNYTNTGLLYADLSVDNGGMPQQYDNLSKPAEVPSVSGGVLWDDSINKKFYLYGGEFQIAPQSFTLWSYDAIYDKWSSMTPDPTGSGIQRASFGASVVVQDRGFGFWYGGALSNATVPTWGSQPQYLSNLLRYDMVKNTWKNSTGYDSIGRAEGVMVYIPSSDAGMLIYFGGIQSPSNNGSWTGQPLDKIFIYDIANDKWYTQKATGNVPEMRRRFCGGATWTKDQSSYNIYIYGGASMPPSTVGFDDLYILSIPSFTWIKWYPTDPGAAYPHHSLSCDVINSSQMIIMGGTFPNSTSCDIPDAYGQHNADLGKQNSDDSQWGDFVYTKKGYKVPSEVIAVVGGSADGGATKLAPSGGFDNPDLATGFAKFYTAQATRTPTRVIPTATGSPKPPPPSKKTSRAVIGGAVGGSIGGLILLGGLAFCCLRRKNKVQQPTQQQVTAPPMGHSSLGYYAVYPAAPAAQLSTGENDHIVELQAAEVAAAHKSWSSAHQGVNVIADSDGRTSGSLLPSPTQSTPPQSIPSQPTSTSSQQPVSQSPHSINAGLSYFPPAPAVYAQPQSYEQPNPHNQVYYPPPTQIMSQNSPPADHGTHIPPS